MLIRNILLLLLLPVAFAACSEDEGYETPVPENRLQNDVIKRSMGPNIVGNNIEFAYAMALPPAKGKLSNAQVEATIAGAGPTYLEHRSFYTNGAGQDVGVVIGAPSVSTGAVTKVDFTVDTSAATLRYFYNVPDAARGKAVSFTFSAQSSDGEKVTYKMGPYNVSKMDMKLDMVVKDAGNCFISIADMAVYNAADAGTKGAAIDLVYIYRALTNATYNHAFVSPVAEAQYLQGATIPVGLTNSCKLVKAWGLRDVQLSRAAYNVFIDDIDFEKTDFTNAPNYAINMKAEAGIWVETADKKYRAYIYINKIDNAGKGATISIKRYPL
ncbi:DUF4466 family protein [Chitinophaga horti]|uniref:DUF4466 family protein n=1 Tax=Chitinophaga horti TaxID=2920382 RepID=A0ABY6IVD7_9BACT|nr:DUF4466 family protein [Chitinophaga horti]UYQ91255.1 DUF4466 family protein [Chitinophaga horti]